MSQFIENLTNRHFIHFQNTMLNLCLVIVTQVHHQRRKIPLFLPLTSIGVLSCLKCFCSKNLSILGGTMSWHSSAWIIHLWSVRIFPRWACFCLRYGKCWGILLQLRRRTLALPRRPYTSGSERESGVPFHLPDGSHLTTTGKGPRAWHDAPTM